MWLKLSLMYGIPVRQLQQQMTSDEFIELAALAKIEGFPGDGWRQAGEICAAVTNSQKSKGRAARASDYMPRYKPAGSLTVDQAELLIRAQATYINGKKVK